MSKVTNAEYIELVEGILEELRPDQPVKIRMKKIKDPRTGRESEKIAVKLDVVRGPDTEVLIDRKELLSLGELQLRALLTGKLVSIGVHPAPVRERTSNVTDAPIKPLKETEAEAAKVRELLAKRRPAEPVEESLQVEPDNDDVAIKNTKK